MGNNLLEAVLSASNCYSATCCGKFDFSDNVTSGIEFLPSVSNNESSYVISIDNETTNFTLDCNVFECINGLSGYIKLNYVKDDKCKCLIANVIGYRTLIVSEGDIDTTVYQFRVDCLPTVLPSEVVWKSVCYSITGPKKCELEWRD